MATDNREENKEEEAEPEAVLSEEEILRAQEEFLRLGPPGLHPGVVFDASDPDWETWQQTWQRRVRNYFRGFYSREEVAPLLDYRIHLSIVTTTSDMGLVHYSFENVTDKERASNICSQLFTLRRNALERIWQKEDIISGQKDEYRLPLTWLTGVGPSATSLPIESFEPDEVRTVTQKAYHKEDGTWHVGHFGDCLPGHTYKFELIYGGVPSNSFTWTAPD